MKINIEETVTKEIEIEVPKYFQKWGTKHLITEDSVITVHSTFLSVIDKNNNKKEYDKLALRSTENPDPLTREEFEEAYLWIINNVNRLISISELV